MSATLSNFKLIFFSSTIKFETGSNIEREKQVLQNNSYTKTKKKQKSQFHHLQSPPIHNRSQCTANNCNFCFEFIITVNSSTCEKKITPFESTCSLIETTRQQISFLYDKSKQSKYCVILPQTASVVKHCFESGSVKPNTLSMAERMHEKKHTSSNDVLINCKNSNRCAWHLPSFLVPVHLTQTCTDDDECDNLNCCT